MNRVPIVRCLDFVIVGLFLAVLAAACGGDEQSPAPPSATANAGLEVTQEASLTPTLLSTASGNHEPPRGILAFAAGGSIYTINADGSGLTQVVQGNRAPGEFYESDWASAPAFSPHGSLIAFTRELDVWLVNFDGSDVRRLADVANWEPSPGASNFSMGASSVSWSPDGSQIAYTLSRVGGSGVSAIGTVGLDGSLAPRFASRPANSGAFVVATWLPEGSIAVSLSNQEVTLLDPASGEETGSVSLPVFPWPPIIAANRSGIWLAGSFVEDGDILVGSPAGMRQVATGVSPAFSPAGDWIAYFSGDSIRLVRTDGSDDHELVNLEALGGRDRQFAAQPDCYPDDLAGCSYRPPLISWSAGGGQTFDDPFAYCEAVGTIDQADDRYAGPYNALEMVLGFARGANVPATSELWSGTNPGPALAWRCADGVLMVCSYGANIPCDSKADTSREPSPAVIDWCANPPPGPERGDRFGVPAAVTGHNTIYLGAWECIDGKPVITGQPLEVDDQGYVGRFWYPVSP
jgi:WD40-like Beta Propeller Repeat